MNDTEFIRALVASHHYPADEGQCAGLTQTYPSIRDGVEALGELVGTTDLAPALGFAACPRTAAET